MLNALLFYLTYAFGFIFSFTINPAIAFALYEAVYFFYPSERWWGYLIPDISYSFYTVLLLLLLVLLNFKQSSQNQLLCNPIFRWIFILLTLYALAYTYAVNSEGHYSATIFYLKLVIIIALAYKLVDTEKKLDIALWGYIFGSWYISVATFQVGRNSGNRVEGIGTVDAPDSNGIAAALAPALVLCLYYFWSTHNKILKLLFTVGGLFIANAIMLINSRGAFLAVSISILYFMIYLYFSKTQKQYQKLSVIIIAIAGLAGTIYLADDSFIRRIQTMQTTEVDDSTESGATRIIFWKASWNMAKDHPFGAGFRGFDYYAPLYIPEHINTGNSRNRSVHSTWFETLSEVGYVGLVVFLILLYRSYACLKQCKLSLKDDSELINQYFKIVAIEAALLGFIVAMTFMNRMRAEVLYWLFLYAACAYNIYVLKNDKTNDQYPKNTT